MTGRGSAESQLRSALFGSAALVFLFAPAELLLLEHWGSPPQLIPFALSFVGLVAAGVGQLAPSRARLRAVRVALVAVALGTLFGVWEHLEHNLEFAREIAPNATTSSLVVESLTGANPLLAPGLFGLGALLAFFGTWRHPSG